MYLADLFPPEPLIIGMLLTPRLDFAVPTLEIVRIRLQPSLVALPLALCPTRWILAALLDLPGPRIRFVIPAAVGTPLLSPSGCFHPFILTDEGVAELMGGQSGNERNEIHWVSGGELNQE